MSRKQSLETENAGRGWFTYAVYVLASAVFVLAAAVAIFIYSRVDQFLASDPRFRLDGPSEHAGGPGLHVDGVVHASRAKIVNAFASDFDRSIYLVPLRERRRNLLVIDWVKEATVSRLWPDRLNVRIVERTPVAFVQLPGSSARSVALIDADGIVLDLPRRAKFSLPVLTGIRREQDLEMRRVRVQQALRLIAELGEMARDISEIDVSDPENLAITQQLQGRAVVLLIGNRNFRPRLRNFLDHHPEIFRRLPRVTSFDLRLDDRITAVEEGSRG